MAKGNKKGPYNQGPMTGRGMGYCAGFHEPGYMNPGFGGGRGRGFGGGGGMGWRHGQGGGGGRGRGFGWGGGMGRGFHPGMAVPPWAEQGYPGYEDEDELEFLKTQAKSYESDLKTIRKRMDSLERDMKQDKD